MFVTISTNISQLYILLSVTVSSRSTAPRRESTHICDNEVMRAWHFGIKTAVERVEIFLARWLVGDGWREGGVGG